MNNKYKIHYLPIAVQDLENILEYIKADNPSAAPKLLDLIDKTISTLNIFSFKGSTPKDPRLQKLGYRILIINNYLVFYIVKTNTLEIEIRRILSGKQKYDFLL